MGKPQKTWNTLLVNWNHPSDFSFFILCIHILSHLNKHLHVVDYLAHVHTLTLREKKKKISLLCSLTSPQPSILSPSSSSSFFSLRGATRNRREPPCHFPPQAFSCLVIYFLHFTAEGRGMSHRIGHLITGEKMLLSALSQSATSLNLKKKRRRRERKRQT